MDWVKVAEAAIGTFTGGAIALASMWIKELIDRRKVAQTWYEQYYIAEGIDRLLSHVRIMDLQMAALIPASQIAAEYETKGQSFDVGRLPRSEVHEAYPLEALVRLETLLKDGLISSVVTISHNKSDFMQKFPPGSRSQTLMISSLNQIRNLYGHLRTIRTELLKVKVKQKSDIEDVSNRPDIKQALDQLRQFTAEWQAKTEERDQLISQGK